MEGPSDSGESGNVVRPERDGLVVGHDGRRGCGGKGVEALLLGSGVVAVLLGTGGRAGALSDRGVGKAWSYCFFVAEIHGIVVVRAVAVSDAVADVGGASGVYRRSQDAAGQRDGLLGACWPGER